MISEARLAAGIRWSAIRQIALTVIGTAAVLTYTRQLGPERMGTFTFAIIFYSALLLLIQAPFRDAVVYFQEKSYENAAFYWLMGLAVPAAALLILAAPWVGRFYDSPDSVIIIQGMAVVFVLRSLAEIPAAVLLKRFDFASHEGFQLVADAVFSLIVLAGLLIFNGGLVVLVIAHLGAGITWLGLVWWRTRFRPKWRVDGSIYREVWRFARALLGSQAIKYANLNFDQILVGRLGEKPLGLYSFGETQSAFIVVGVGVPMQQITLPALASVKQKSAEFKDIFLKLMRLTHAASMPYHVFVFILADQFIVLFFGEAWVPAAPILRAYLVFRLLQTLGQLCDAALSALGRPDLRFKFDLILLPAFIGATIGSVAWSGEPAVVAISLAAVRSVVMGIYLGFTLWLSKISAVEWVRSLGGLTLATFIGGAAIVFLRWGPIVVKIPVWPGESILGPIFSLAIELTLYGLIGITIYLAAFFLLDRPGFKDVFKTIAQAVFPSSKADTEIQ